MTTKILKPPVKPRKHGMGCDACLYQDRINKLCADKPFNIEYDFFSEAGEVSMNESHTLSFIDSLGGQVSMPLMAPFEVQEYKRDEPINVLHYCSNDGIRTMIKDAEKFIQEHENNFL